MGQHKRIGFMPYILMLLSAVIVGLSFMFGKFALEHAHPLDILAHRFSLAFLTALLYKVLRREQTALDASQRRSLLPLALMYPLLFFLLQIFGLRYASATQSGLINATAPIFTVLFARVMLKERVSGLQMLGVILATGGVILLQWMNRQSHDAIMFWGLFLILASVVAMALNTILLRLRTRQFSWFQITYFVLKVGCVVFVTIALLRHLLAGTIAEFLRPLLHMDYLLSILYLGVLSSFVTSLISAFSLTLLPAVPVSIFGSFSTVVSIFAGVILLKEDFHTFHLAGTLMILSGVLMVNLFKHPPK